jgi:hypothetical protein
MVGITLLSKVPAIVDEVSYDPCHYHWLDISYAARAMADARLKTSAQLVSAPRRRAAQQATCQDHSLSDKD